MIFKEIKRQIPKLTDFIEACRHSPTFHHERKLELKWGAEKHAVQAKLDRIVMSGRKKRCWLLTLLDSAAGVSVNMNQFQEYQYNSDTEIRNFRLQVQRLEGSKVEENSCLPHEFRLAQNYPNPFNPETQIRYELPQSASVRITIHNHLGQLVRTLKSGNRSAGFHTVVWDGCDDFGHRVTSGIYFYRLQTDNQHSEIRKMLLVK